MKRYLVVVEGQTEEQFVKEVLSPYLLPYEVFLIPKIIVTKTVKNGANFKGGIINFNQVKRDVENCLKDSSARTTTFIDYYGLPTDFPGFSVMESNLTCYQKIKFLEDHFSEAIADSSFIPYIQLHEFESLLFSSTAGFEYFYPDSIIVDKINEIIDEFSNPEEINNNPITAPSKRIKNIIPGYNKVNQGSLIALENKVETLISKCPHFSEWIDKLIHQ